MMYHQTRIIGADGVDNTHHSPNLKNGLMCHKVHGKPSCLIEGEWGPTDKGSFVAADPFHLQVAHLGSGSWMHR